MNDKFPSVCKCDKEWKMEIVCMLITTPIIICSNLKDGDLIEDSLFEINLYFYQKEQLTIS